MKKENKENRDENKDNMKRKIQMTKKIMNRKKTKKIQIKIKKTDEKRKYR